LPSHRQDPPISQPQNKPLTPPAKHEYVGTPSTVGLTEARLAEMAAANPSVIIESKPDTNSSEFEKPEVTADNQHQILADIVTPLWQMRYFISFRIILIESMNLYK